MAPIVILNKLLILLYKLMCHQLKKKKKSHNIYLLCWNNINYIHCYIKLKIFLVFFFICEKNRIRRCFTIPRRWTTSPPIMAFAHNLALTHQNGSSLTLAASFTMHVSSFYVITLELYLAGTTWLSRLVNLLELLFSLPKGIL